MGRDHQGLPSTMVPGRQLPAYLVFPFIIEKFFTNNAKCHTKIVDRNPDACPPKRTGRRSTLLTGELA
jgi:hypothetical protein